MTSNFEETQKLYKEFLERTEECIVDTDKYIQEDGIKSFNRLIQSARRIFFTAAGSSIPSAIFGAFYLSGKGFSSQFVSTGQILSSKFNKSDVIILCTQGFNRGDSILITKKIKRDGAVLIIFTANRESAFIKEAELAFFFSPFPEKLFCRPVGVMTGIEAVAKVILPDFFIDEAINACKNESNIKPILFEEKCKYIVLSSGLGNPIGFNFALALREGCGIDAVFYDIETYGHGMYVSDQVYKSKGNYLKYLIIDIEMDSHSHKAVERILPFVKDTYSLYEIISSKNEVPYAYFDLLSQLSQSIYFSNEKNNYDMNNPPGKEENRYYHIEETYLL